MTGRCDPLPLLVEAQWREYARPRFASGERTTRESTAWAEFQLLTANLFSELRRRAARAKWPLDYELENLQLAVLKALELPCAHCNELFGLKTWAVSYVTSPGLGGPNQYKFVNLMVSCSRCAVARGDLSARVWIGILAQLNAEHEEFATDFLEAVVTGRLVTGAGGIGGAKVLPGPAGSQVTRERRGRCSDGAEK